MRYGLIISALAIGCSSEKGVAVYNTSPSATILEPVASAQFESDETIDFVGQVDDGETAPESLLVSWATDVEGILTDDARADVDGRVTYSTNALSPGEHVVSLRVLDSRGKSGDTSVSIFIINADDPPTISVRHPAPDGSEKGEEGVPFTFEAIVGDPQDAALDLVVTVTRLAEEGDENERLCVALPDADGVATCQATLGEGTFSLTFEVEDTDGNITEATVTHVVESGLDIDNDGDGFTENEGDCDDLDYDTKPGAFESLNGVDDDCNGLVDDTTTAYDDDGDGFSEEAGDCNDSDPSIHPLADEVCDGIDNDCNGIIDGADAIDAVEWFADLDDDGFGALASMTAACTAPEGTVADSSDCNDTDPASYPGATETCDGADNNCDGDIDEEGAVGCSSYYLDSDGDGYGTTESICACAPAGDYTSALSSDCYDESSIVNPTHTSFHSSPRGDGSYDYNCDDEEEKRYTELSDECAFFSDFGCTSPNGWQIPGDSCDSPDPADCAPPCGEPGTWRSGCSYRFEWFESGCYWDSEVPRTQQCR